MGEPKDKWCHLSVRQLVSFCLLKVCFSDAGDNSQPAGVDARMNADCHDIPPGSVSCHAGCVVGLGLRLGEGWIWVRVECGEGPGAKGLQRTELQLQVRLGTLTFVSHLVSSWCVSPTPQPLPRECLANQNRLFHQNGGSRRDSKIPVCLYHGQRMRFALVLIGHGGRPRHPPHPAIRQRRAVRPTQLSRPRPPSALRPTTLPGRRLWPSDGCSLCATAFSTAPHWTFSPSKSWTRSITMTLGSTVVRPLVRPIIISGGPFGLDV